jgi:glycerophosphoryl diester phosphodiesterase
VTCVAVAHRGDPYAALENTLEAFAAAARAGAGMIELDVRRSADGAAVVMHDETLKRVWGDPRRIADLALEELRRVQRGGHRIPTLADVLDAVETPLMVDYMDADVVEPAVQAVERAGALDRVVFAGENVAGHRLVRRLAPKARIALTWESDEPADALLTELGAEFFNPPHERVSAEIVSAMHARGTAVSTWTVDSDAEIRRVLDAGVDAVITNRIGSLVSLLAGAEAPC